MPPRWHLGTMGFGYKEWAGVFYPADVRPADYLRHYATAFDAVELDTTWHAAPPPGRVAHWASMVPAGFRFTVKTPKAVTHELPTGPAVTAFIDFLQLCEPFGEKLACVLLQFPPSFEITEWDKLAALLDAAHGRNVRLAVELRNSTWGVSRTLDLLRKRRVCLVAAEYLTMPHTIYQTADFMYVRWIGQHDRYPEKNREVASPAPNLRRWLSKLEGLDARDIYGFFNNDYSGYSISSVERLRALLKQPLRVQPVVPQQPMLFPK